VYFLQRKILSSSLGFAAGVMLAASYWSLLAPAVELTKTSGYWSGNALLEIIPVTLGFLLGALFVYLADGILDSMGVSSPAVALAVATEKYGTFNGNRCNNYSSGLFILDL
jgi:zinc transporter ZupT